jgi:hypothetical protein
MISRLLGFGARSDLKHLIELVAQADTNGHLRDSDSNRDRILVEAAKSFTRKYRFFPYWRK